MTVLYGAYVSDGRRRPIVCRRALTRCWWNPDGGIAGRIFRRFGIEGGRLSKEQGGFAIGVGR